MRLSLNSIIVMVLLGFMTSKSGAQTSVTLDGGIGGGVTMPTADAANSMNSGYHLGALLRLKELLPFDVVASASYNSMSLRDEDAREKLWVGGLGVDLPVSMAVLNPYVSVQALASFRKSPVPGVSSSARYGIGLGPGVGFSVPLLGDFDASVKYQLINLFGKQTGEASYSQIVANLSIIFPIL